jgi:hypothetical protein
MEPLAYQIIDIRRINPSILLRCIWHAINCNDLEQHLPYMGTSFTKSKYVDKLLLLKTMKSIVKTHTQLHSHSSNIL